jgi:hypothetical protein
MVAELDLPATARRKMTQGCGPMRSQLQWAFERIVNSVRKGPSLGSAGLIRPFGVM